jgi:hypothetical protein
MKVTRRELVALLAAAGGVAAQDAPEDVFKRNTDALDQYDLKQDVEPAFAFKA